MVYQDEYEWTSNNYAIPTASSPVNRAEGYVVLSVVNEILEEIPTKDLVTGQLLERLLIDHLPNPNWSRSEVLEWLKNKLQTN